jgi:hypothetical protein
MPIIKTEEQLFDLRLIQRNIQKGLIRQKDYERYVKSLADMTENAGYITKELILDVQGQDNQKQESPGK